MPTHSDNPHLDAAPNHDPEVSGRVTRRRFTSAQKARILEEYDRGSAVERASLCRRERIYSSLISNWRKQLADGRPLAEKRGRKPDLQGQWLERCFSAGNVTRTRLAAALAVQESRIADYSCGQKTMRPVSVFLIGEELRKLGAPTNGLLSLHEVGHFAEYVELLRFLSLTEYGAEVARDVHVYGELAVLLGIAVQDCWISKCENAIARNPGLYDTVLHATEEWLLEFNRRLKCKDCDAEECTDRLCGATMLRKAYNALCKRESPAEDVFEDSRQRDADAVLQSALSIACDSQLSYEAKRSGVRARLREWRKTVLYVWSDKERKRLDSADEAYEQIEHTRRLLPSGFDAMRRARQGLRSKKRLGQGRREMKRVRFVSPWQDSCIAGARYFRRGEVVNVPIDEAETLFTNVTFIDADLGWNPNHVPRSE